ncbi:enoyl-CoA hydratase/isomerase family protein [Saccharothrix obliqua]|uniref:enoyl-CoA hydratase/isomerase family protein n=1 Tax=Saccharothrix obliqua TaxID=2861747 RepID=UPI001C5EB42B|nr:enoyl-CoA hydratase/isomerase family protein [Saccharothrix obliqua]MBW4722365.1 enoyl-CoA hydratase/isomerase family protein [Saccharothrix obliqua]
MPAVSVRVEHGIGTVLLDRPPVNALDRDARGLLRLAAEEMTRRDDVRAVVLRGVGRFSAGADIAEMATSTHEVMRVHAPVLQAAFAAVAAIGKPVVAAITGFALGGGCELALTADRRVIAEDATIGLPEVRLGIIPGAGGTQRLPRLVGPAVAKDLIYTGRVVSAAEALAIGLVDEVVPAADVVAAATAWAARFVTDSPKHEPPRA